jgi:hypothetical protein
VGIRTSIAIVIARTPVMLGYFGQDLALYTEEQFIVRLCPQVKPHIERWF